MRCSIPRAAWCSARPTTVCRCRWPCSIGCSSPEVSEKSLMIMHRSDQALAIRALRSAAPYIRMYKGKTFVVKAGGGVFADPPATRVLVEQIAILHHFGVRVVLVHGGGPQLTELSAALGVPTRMVDGRRVTDQRSIDVTAMVRNGLMPVVSPLSADESGTLLNINADTVAAALGAALQAEKLILCTGAPGILGSVADPRSLISYTDLKGLKRLRDEGHIAAGMLPKAKAIEDALRGGVRRVHVVSYQSPEGILGEVFTNEGTGT